MYGEYAEEFRFTAVVREEGLDGRAGASEDDVVGAAAVALVAREGLAVANGVLEAERKVVT